MAHVVPLKIVDPSSPQQCPPPLLVVRGDSKDARAIDRLLPMVAGLRKTAAGSFAENSLDTSALIFLIDRMKRGVVWSHRLAGASGFRLSVSS
jgi:hypothetical protein